MHRTFDEEYGVWVYCATCRSWICMRSVDDIHVVAPDEVTFVDPYCEKPGRSKVMYDEKPKGGV